MAKHLALYALVFVLGSMTGSYAGEADNTTEKESFAPRIDFRDYGYSVGWETEQPNQSYLPERQGLVTLQDKDEIKAYLALKLRKLIDLK